MDRLGSYIIKALRESGENTNWEYPSTHYEQKCLEFAGRSVVEIEDHWKGTSVRGLPGLKGNIRNLITGESVSSFLLEDVLNESLIRGPCHTCWLEP